MDDAERDEVEAQRAGALADELRRLQAEEAALHARRARVLADAYALTQIQTARIPSAASKQRDMPLRSMAAELGMAVRVNDRTMQSHLWDAHVLTTSFEPTLAALEAGRITRAHVSAIVDTGAAIDEPSARAAFEQTVLAFAEATTPARTRAYARQQADIFNSRTMQERHDLAAAGRRVWVTDLDDGMSLLSHLLPTVIAHGILDRTTQQAKQIKRLDAVHRREVAGFDDDVDEVWFDERTLDQIRADLVADMLLTGTPLIDPSRDTAPGGLGAIRANVQITVPVTTLTGVTSGGPSSTASHRSTTSPPSASPAVRRAGIGC